MSKAEKEFMAQIDEIILNSSKEQLRPYQEIDIKNQLVTKNFYDAVLHDGKLISANQ